MSFTIDSRLETSSFPVTSLGLCDLRLHSNATWPWLILVPRRENMSDLIDLAAADQAAAMYEIDRVAQTLRKLTNAYKLNIASIGNVVRQLHIHIIARQEGDAAWPAPVWNQPFNKAYDESEKSAFIAKLKDELEKRN